MPSTTADLFRNTQLKVADGRFVLVGISPEGRRRADEDLSPFLFGDLPFMIFQDGVECTILIREEEWKAASISLPEARLETGFRLVTIDRELSWDVVGFLAKVTACLAEAGISVGVLSSFSRDHLLIKAVELERALAALNELFDNVGSEAADGTVLDR